MVATAREHARQWVAGRAGPGGPEAAELLADDLVLIVSELVTNSLRAQATEIELRLCQIGDRHLEVAVADNGVGWPTLLNPDATDGHGRGLQIVRALAVRWGVRTEPDGRTVVWAQLSDRAANSDGHR